MLQTVLEQMPIPDSQTSWEAIIDFRNDPDVREKLVRLRHWTSQVSRSDLTPAEIRDELEYLQTEYEAARGFSAVRVETRKKRGLEIGEAGDNLGL